MESLSRNLCFRFKKLHACSYPRPPSMYKLYVFTIFGDKGSKKFFLLLQTCFSLQIDGFLALFYDGQVLLQSNPYPYMFTTCMENHSLIYDKGTNSLPSLKLVRMFDINENRFERILYVWFLYIEIK